MGSIEKITTSLINLFSKESGSPIVRANSIEKDNCTAPSELPAICSSEVSKSLLVTDEYTQVLSCINDKSQVIFITGKAGTGKSSFIRFLREKLGFYVPVIAPTGVAALNVNGQTIHSFFQFPPRIVNPEDIRLLKNHRLFEKLRLLIIDEVSMVRADLMDAIDLSLRLNTGRSDLAFGGIQIVLVGDLLQLPPVIAGNSEMQYLYNKYRTPCFLSANCIQKTPPVVIELTRVFRQQDQRFVDLLSKIRMGESLEKTVSIINSCCLINGNAMTSDITTLTPENWSADRINNRELGILPGESIEFEGIISGRFNIEENRLPSPKLLKLKPGARVMLTKNDMNHRWVNGTPGTVTAICDSFIIVKTSAGLFDIKREVWETIQYVYNEKTGKITAETIGSYTQFPLMLAWAITIHKSQGKTLDKVLIDLGNGAFAQGQVYVALSRCKTLDGIRLKKPIRVSDIKVDAVVKEFYSRI
ncbi:MAG TPA: DEAD/DEAH box helicase [Chitinispirillaceae bacterium]|nr:DEAD/DEAH box helicase [Chitinispirillaceae bacterium]